MLNFMRGLICVLLIHDAWPYRSIITGNILFVAIAVAVLVWVCLVPVNSRR